MLLLSPETSSTGPLLLTQMMYTPNPTHASIKAEIIGTYVNQYIYIYMNDAIPGLTSKVWY